MCRTMTISSLIDVPAGPRSSRTVDLGLALGADLVEDVVVALLLELEGHARLLEQVLLDVGARDLSARPEVDADELTLCE